ncbi:two-component system sensor histidine kinase DesK [Streptomyces sp. V4I23]|uniref:sensor histidine kinase n=1 Tax=Streptomyces sp. V4I23 TaxID=3042282 RepID=UPI00277EFFE9|nr:histidine kinase [Streptomyces sp. V4I23]MDQ1008577.1 two-component system sensor histidine kinase DesK [Streptomyces sp. V4I23]
MESGFLPKTAPITSRVNNVKSLAPKLAITITTVVLGAFCFVAVTYELSARPSLGACVEAMVLLLLIFVIQLQISFPRFLPGLGRHRLILVFLQALLTYVPFLTFKQAWLPLPGLLSGSVLLVLPDVLAWPFFVLIVAGTDVLQFFVGLGWREVSYTTVSTVLTGLVVFGLSRLTDMVAEVHRSRADLARLAVDQERLRFARDLHDLLGYSLSTITLKCELAYRLLPGQTGRVQQELTEILHTSRQALSDVRAVASGYRDMNLSTEVADAESMLAALDIATTARIESGPLPRDVDTVLATVLREGLTNMLRHSNASRCSITSLRRGRTVTFRLANDGVDGRTVRLQPMASEEGNGNSGIRNLSTRVEALRGTLTAGSRYDGWFELQAVVELPHQDLEKGGPDDRVEAGDPRPGAGVHSG